MTTTHSGRTIRHTIVFCKNCRKTYELGDSPNPCPECSTPWNPTRTEGTHNLALQERLYGTTNNPKFNLGLGVHTTGKKDRDAKAAQRKMEPY